MEISIRGRRALVTGASSGLGEAIARELASRGSHLVLLARRAERLEELASLLRAQFDVSVDVLALDLTDPNAARSVRSWIAEDEARDVDILVNNAGFGAFGPAIDLEPGTEDAMLALNIAAVVGLTRTLLPGMRERRFGLILQVASLAGFVALPKYATYAATKAFVLSFGQALSQELKGSDVGCTTLCPGITDTEFFRVAGHVLTPLQRAVRMTPAAVARSAVRGLLKRRSLVVPGTANVLTTGLIRLFPRSVVTAIADRLF